MTMSLRRKSCNACFQGRRKCDLAFPTCQRCEKTGKSCQYVAEADLVALKPSGPTRMAAETSTDCNDRSHEGSNLWNSYTLQEDLIEESSLPTDMPSFGFDFTTQRSSLTAPNLLDELGGLSPLNSDVESWQWVIEQLQKCPGDFAKAGENVFIHPSMYRHQSPPFIKAAFGICTASQMVTPATKALLAGSVENETKMLLNTSTIGLEDIKEGLGRLQAMLMYQILRLLCMDSVQQRVGEEQKGTINAQALQLLQKVRAESLSPRTYETLVLTESVRRTVITLYLLHALSSIFKHGVCTELPMLALLPVSMESKMWESRNIGDDLGTMKYGEWTDMWVAFAPRRRLDAFQKMLMVACKGKVKVEELEAEAI